MQALSRDSLTGSAVSMSRSLHNFSALKRFAEIEAHSEDLSMQTQVMFARKYLERKPSEVEKFRAFVNSLGPQEQQEFRRRSYWALASVDLIHKARLYFANTWPLAFIATPIWLGVSWADNFRNTWELGALTLLVTTVVGYRAVHRDPYYNVVEHAREMMDEVFRDGQ